MNLKHTFSANQYIQASREVIFPENLTTRAQWIIGRSLCLYRTFELDALPDKNREDALSLLVKRWAPFSRVGYHAVWTEHCVGVWAWDAERVESAIEEVGVQAISTLPESVYLPKSDETRAQWLPSVDTGRIFQLWINGVLVAEKWFAEKPEQSKFDLFLRSLTLPASLTMEWKRLQTLSLEAAEIEEVARLATPWGAKNKTLSIVQKLPWEHSLLLCGAAAVLTGYVWAFSSTVFATMALSEIKQRADLVATEVETVLDARSTAETLNQQAQSQILLIDYPSQSSMMLELGQIFMEFNLVLNEWDFKGSTLEVVSQGNVNTLDVVKRMETLDWVESVSVSSLRNRNQNRFVLTLESQR
ncbi:hypothetical protein [Alteromonas flava]|uniref:hypothetical protein n=1 Tax=Alteromonas flava TaxID=2048003 RepID=UPI0013D9DF33|nr:hypothetical protein [Alteromonas flava]